MPTETSRLLHQRSVQQRNVQQKVQYQSISSTGNTQKKSLTIKALPLPDLADCSICHQQLTKKFPLSSPAKNKEWCIGCARLLGPYKNDMDTRTRIIKELSIPRKQSKRRRRGRNRKRKKKNMEETSKIILAESTLEPSMDIPEESTSIPSMTSTILVPYVEPQVQDVDYETEDQLPTSCFSSCFPFGLIRWVRNRFHHKKQYIPMQETPYQDQHKATHQPHPIQIEYEQPKQAFWQDSYQSIERKDQNKCPSPKDKKVIVQNTQQQTCQQKSITKNKTQKEGQKLKVEIQKQKKQTSKQMTQKQASSSLPHLLQHKASQSDKGSATSGGECFNFNYSELALRSIRTMRNRTKKFRRFGFQEFDIPSQKELIELMIESKNTCAISGIKGHWSAANFHSPFRLDFDHKIPLSMGGSFRAENLQVTLNCLNSVKGAETQDELKRWLKGFRESKPKLANSL